VVIGTFGVSVNPVMISSTTSSFTVVACTPTLAAVVIRGEGDVVSICAGGAELATDASSKKARKYFAMAICIGLAFQISQG